MDIQIWPLNKVIPYARNARKHDPHVAKLAGLLVEFGWKQPMVVDSEGVLIIGHRRRLAALSLGWTEGPVLVASDLSPVKVKALRLADNRVHEDVEWDQDLLSLELEELHTEGFDLALTAFEAGELTKLLSLEDLSAAEDVVAPEDFKEFDEGIETEHTCPKCGYQWSGGKSSPQ